MCVWSTADREVTKANPKKLKMKRLTIGGVPVELLEIEDAANALGLGTETVRREIWRKRMGSVKMCGRVYVRREQLEEYITRCTRPAATQEATR